MRRNDSMAEKKRVITRRDFIRAGSHVVVGGLMGFPLLRNAAAKTTPKRRRALMAPFTRIGSLSVSSRWMFCGVSFLYITESQTK